MLATVTSPGTKAFTVRLPEPLADAVEAEAFRTVCRPVEVLRDVLVRKLPEYIAERIRDDARATGRVIDVRSSDGSGASDGVAETPRSSEVPR